MSQINSPADIQQLANTFRQSRVFLTAFELGIFTPLDKKPLTSEQVAITLKTSPRATDRLLNVLVNIGLLIKENNLFSNTAIASKHLVKGKTGYMAGLSHTVNLWDSWTTLSEVVKKGESIDLESEVNDRGENWLDAFIAAMHSRGSVQGKELCTLLDLSKSRKLLDLGGGSGIFSVEFIKAFPNLKATVFDLPNVIPLTKKYIDNESMSGLIDTLSGNYLIDNIGSDYDSIFLSAIIHSNSPDENKLLIKKCFDALNPKGQIIIVDYLMSNDRLTPEVGALFAINMLVATDEGDTYTETEVKGWLRVAGFKNIICENTSWYAGILISEK